MVIADLSRDPSLQRHTGFIPEVIWRLSANLNFTVQLTFPPDGQWGSINESGIWTGMVGELKRGKADISSGALSIITQRAQVIDFTQPVLLDTITLTSQVRTKRCYISNKQLCKVCLIIKAISLLILGQKKTQS